MQVTALFFPPNIIVTTQKPDLVLIDEAGRRIIIFELKCPFDSNIEKQHGYKMNKYAALVGDLSTSFSVDLYCFEVSVRGQICRQNKARLKSFLLASTGLRHISCKELIVNVSKAALLCSFSLFCARNEGLWSSHPDLSVLVTS